jgi:hypothetical protein
MLNYFWMCLKLDKNGNPRARVCFSSFRSCQITNLRTEIQNFIVIFLNLLIPALLINRNSVKYVRMSAM